MSRRVPAGPPHLPESSPGGRKPAAALGWARLLRQATLLLVLSVGAAEGFWDVETIGYAASEVEGAETEEASAYVRLERGALQRRARPEHGRDDAQCFPKPSLTSLAQRLRGQRDHERLDVGPGYGRRLLHRHRRLLI